jgi:hypothetical protein
MADKQQNITVNYKFNTADIDRASAILSRANQASNQLQQSGQKAGDNIAKGFNTATRSIVSMETELARLKTIIQVSTDPKRIAELSNQYKSLEAQIKAANKAAFETPKALKATGQAATTATQGFGGLVSAAKALVTVGLVKELGEMALSLATLRGNVEGVEQAFARRFANAPALLERLRTATQRAIPDLELMQRALSATNLGVDVKALPELLEFATRRAKETGRSVDDLVDRIVRGIGLKSTKVLDDLGISALRVKDALGGVSLEAASVEQVTQAVGKIAKEELDKMGEAAENSATKVAQMNVAFEQLRVTLAKKLETSFITDIGTQTAKGLENLLKLITGGFNELDREALTSQASRTAATILESKAYKELGDDRQKQIDFLQQEINTDVERIGRINDVVAALTEERKIIQDKNPYDKRVDQLAAQIRGYNGSKFAIMEVIKFLKQYRDEVMKVNEVEGETPEASGIISRKQKEIELIQEQIKFTNNLDDLTRTVTDEQGNQIQVVGKLIKELEIAQAELADLQRAFSTGIDPKISNKAIDDATKSLTDFETTAKRIEEGMRNLSLAPDPGKTQAKLDTFWTGLNEFWQDEWRNLVADSADFQADVINNLLESEIDSMQAAMNQLKRHYQERQELAGDNERAKSELRIREDRELQVLAKRQFEREKSLRKAQVVVDGAAAAIKAFVTAPNVYVAIAQAAFIAATTIAQLRNIEKAQPRFAKGVINLQGPGTGTSDSIPARLSKGESVMTAWETKHAGDVLKDVRAKKLDNKALREMKQGRAPIIGHQQFDDAKIIQAINANKPPDVVKQSNIVYEVRQHTETMRRKQRAKSMNI